jgi:hypothetical protein
MNGSMLAEFHLSSSIPGLRWNSASIDPFIKTAMGIVSDVDGLVKWMKDNVRKMQDMMKKWLTPLFERRLKAFPPDELE